MADDIVIMDKGKILQQGTPEQIYHDPNNTYIAQFIGSPAMNVLPLDAENRFGFRPEAVQLTREKVDGARYCRKGVIQVREMLGSETLYQVAFADGQTVSVKMLNDQYRSGDHVVLNVGDNQLYFFDRDGQRIRRAAVGDAQYAALLQTAGGMSDV